MPVEQSRANELLVHLVPSHVLMQAQKLAKRFEREEKFKTYLAARFWIIFPAAILFLLVSAACAYGVGSFALVLAHFGQGQPLLFQGPLVTVGFLLMIASPVVAVCAFFLQLYLLFGLFEQRAVSQGELLVEPEQAPVSMPWRLVVILIAIPLMLAVCMGLARIVFGS